MAKNDFSLLPGEVVELKTNPHWWFFWKHALAVLIFVGVVAFWSWAGLGGKDGFAGTVGTTGWWIILIAFIVIVLACVLRFIEWRTTTFIVTDKRIAYQAGLIRRSGMSIQLNRINNVSYDQGIWERALGNGTITIESAATEGTTTFRNIPRPNETRQLIYREIEGDEQRDSTRDGQAVADAIREGFAAQGVTPTATPATPSASDRLQELTRLHDQGLINDADFEAKKADILKDL